MLVYSSSSSSLNSASAPTWDPANLANRKGVVCGSGSDMMNDPRPMEAILNMVNKPINQVQVVYLGTATYDIKLFELRQTERFVEMGCSVTALRVSEKAPANMHEIMNRADVIVVGGGNTLYAVDRWRDVGLIKLLRQALERGAVMCGGSAGAICWFDGGHSNSMDPDTYKEARRKKFGDDHLPSKFYDESHWSPEIDGIKEWKYIRIPALGFLPGLVSPHHDQVQSNGVLRGDDFDRVLLQSPGERGIAIDHWAGLVIDGEDFRVLSFHEKPGSVGEGGNFVTDGSGVPGVWIKEVVDGKVGRWLCPPQGKVRDLLREAREIIHDRTALKLCRLGNPLQWEEAFVAPKQRHFRTRTQVQWDQSLVSPTAKEQAEEAAISSLVQQLAVQSAIALQQSQQAKQHHSRRQTCFNF